jgi:hypothetical protein
VILAGMTCFDAAADAAARGTLGTAACIALLIADAEDNEYGSLMIMES